MHKNHGKMCLYACFSFDSVSQGMRELEGYLSSVEVPFVRFLDPDPDVIAQSTGGIYSKGRFITVLEIRGELSRAFYLFSTELPFEVEDFMKPDFAVSFKVNTQGGFEALLRTIVRRKVSGVTFKHRNLLSFIASFGMSMAFSSLLGFDNILIQATVFGVMAFFLFMVLDYPFSMLSFKGVSVVSRSKGKAGVLLVMKGEKGV